MMTLETDQIKLEEDRMMKTIMSDLKEASEGILKRTNRDPRKISQGMMPTVMRTVMSKQLTTESTRELAANMIALLYAWGNK